ncbi:MULTISPECIES: hypothetical protein [Sphaerospermopsis]|jgi:hypothetical protein|uniref:Uncharacterized protein n=1 Tax=Sphaerospermopsis torques-reginae ITEP-024 TaxID=984208 RepID=A0ABX8X3T1_9CYAN|nr:MULTISPECIES: hypothetical protein [Sphaerospermopsis]MBE9056467.1 hypothetical protein [Sphaerospermopsis sp. LEGE 08334]QYX33326.1 hypothetical protein K2F26_08415 [Sphaerospermopsis torques-reginae ITEP-024]
MIKYFVMLLVFIFACSFSFTSPALATVCRNYQGQEICILSIKRSAKKYWEYRASVSINGKKTPMEVYNCRGKFKVNKDGNVTQFKGNSPGEMICSFFNK